MNTHTQQTTKLKQLNTTEQHYNTHKTQKHTAKRGIETENKQTVRQSGRQAGKQRGNETEIHPKIQKAKETRWLDCSL